MGGIWFRRASPRYQRSPFGGEIQDFADWLDHVGYSRDSIEGHLQRLFSVLSRAPADGPAHSWSEPQLRELFEAHCTTISRSAAFRATQRLYGRFLGCRGRLVAVSPKDPIERLQRRYLRYLREVRGFSTNTADAHISTVRGFLQDSMRGGRRISSLQAADIEAYLAKRSRAIRRQTLQHVVAHLRGFLRYGFTSGILRRPIDQIDTPRTYRGELPPRALPWSTILALLRTVDRSSKAGWRDAAILHLMAYYGLRASEIAALRLDALDWQAATMKVTQRKTRSDLVLPLAPKTLHLLRGYLRHERGACPLPYLFLRIRRPIGPLQHYAVCDIFYKRATQSGLDLKDYASYSLRHSFAMRLLERNVGIKAIGDLLGHRSLEATCVYLRLDTTALRSVGLPLP
jgi:integrase/recombinase XerD